MIVGIDETTGKTSDWRELLGSESKDVPAVRQRPKLDGTRF